MHKLMIVDDSNIIRKRIERCFDKNQFDLVAVAVDGQDAVKKCNQHLPDVVTMDLTMPNMDGLACIRALIEIKPTINILVVSALSDKATGLLAIKYGARGFLCKPFTDEQLIDGLNKMVRFDLANRVKDKK
ncbi:MAG: response regulator [Neisseriaceae bacterium]|nr:response regulator [Neisseriaceae bacterium]